MQVTNYQKQSTRNTCATVTNVVQNVTRALAAPKDPSTYIDSFLSSVVVAEKMRPFELSTLFATAELLI